MTVAFTSKLNSAITYICGLISTVTDSRHVHDGLRDWNDKGTFQALMWDSSTKRIHGWMVTRTASPAEEVNDGLHIRQHDIQILGYYGINDKQTGNQSTSEAQWREIVENICHAIRTDYQLGGLMQDSTCPVVATDDRRTEMETPVHYVDIRLSIFERILV